MEKDLTGAVVVFGAGQNGIPSNRGIWEPHFAKVWREVRFDAGS